MKEFCRYEDSSGKLWKIKEEYEDAETHLLVLKTKMAVNNNNMVNNFEQIRALLQFLSEDIFYFAQIMKHKKEHLDIGSNSIVVRTYYIGSLEAFDRYKDEMILLANYHNARVCISLNQRSFEKSAFRMLKKVTDQIMNKDFKSVKKAYNSVCGLYSEGSRKWIIDVDEPNLDSLPKIKIILSNIQPLGESKFITVIPTKNGYHVITTPFNVMQFKEALQQYEIHKENPTILYIP